MNSAVILSNMSSVVVVNSFSMLPVTYFQSNIPHFGRRTTLMTSPNPNLKKMFFAHKWAIGGFLQRSAAPSGSCSSAIALLVAH